MDLDGKAIPVWQTSSSFQPSRVTESDVRYVREGPPTSQGRDDSCQRVPLQARSNRSGVRRLAAAFSRLAGQLAVNGAQRHILPEGVASRLAGSKLQSVG